MENYRTYEKTKKLCKALEENLSSSYSLDEMVAIAGVNRTTLNQSFHYLYGYSIFKWLREKRLQEAKKLLITTDIPIQILSGQVGYRNSTSFSTAFKFRFGISPRQYRYKDNYDRKNQKRRS